METKKITIVKYSQRGHRDFPEDTWDIDSEIENPNDLYKFIKRVYKNDARHSSDFPLNGHIGGQFTFYNQENIYNEGEVFKGKRILTECPSYFDEAMNKFRLLEKTMQERLPKMRLHRDNIIKHSMDKHELECLIDKYKPELREFDAIKKRKEDLENWLINIDDIRFVFFLVNKGLFKIDNIDLKALFMEYIISLSPSTFENTANMVKPKDVSQNHIKVKDEFVDNFSQELAKQYCVNERRSNPLLKENVPARELVRKAFTEGYKASHYGSSDINIENIIKIAWEMGAAHGDANSLTSAKEAQDEYIKSFGK